MALLVQCWMGDAVRLYVKTMLTLLSSKSVSSAISSSVKQVRGDGEVKADSSEKE